MEIKQRNYTPIIIIISVVIIALIAVLSSMPKIEIDLGFDVKILPLLNAIFNTFTFLFLVAALIAILKKKVKLHMTFIFAAFGTTALFLITYVAHHAFSDATTFGGEGMIQSIYYFILLTHIILAAVIVPLALVTLARGLNGQKEKHKKIARWTMPLWLYVSFTGVLVYLLIAPYY